MDDEEGRCPDCGGWHDEDEEGHDVCESAPGLLRSSPPAPPPPNYFKPDPYAAPPKVGRNDPCPCGSGKKYKKCCGGAG